MPAFTCPACHRADLTAYSYDAGATTTGYECRDCGHTWTENGS